MQVSWRPLCWWWHAYSGRSSESLAGDDGRGLEVLPEDASRNMLGRTPTNTHKIVDLPIIISTFGKSR